jgi:Co/Zn/Cd efflux system component
MTSARPMSRDAEERRVLMHALGIKALIFVVGLVAGLLAASLRLLADSLDMLADAFAYGLSIANLGRALTFKARVSTMGGTLLLLLGREVLFDAVRRVRAGMNPTAQS